MTARWLERTASALVSLHGRAFAASYRDDIIDTLRSRSLRARERGPLVFLLFAVREIAALAWAAASYRLRPRWEPNAVGDPISGDQVAREFRYAGRRLLRAPTFSTAVLITLALSIGATTTMFATVWHIVIASLPYPYAERLIALDHAAPGLRMSSGIGASIGLYREYAALPSIESLALYTVRDGTLSGDGVATRVRFLQATVEIGGLTGMQVRFGRWFTAAECEAGGPAVALLTDAAWRRRFGGDPAVVGRSLRVDGASYEIIGVLEPASPFPDPRIEFVMPLPLPRVWNRAAGFNYDGVARLTDGVTLADARREQDAVIARLPETYPADPEIPTMLKGGLRSLAQPLKTAVVGEASLTLWALLAASAIVFLMACANLANLFLVRHEARSYDLVVQRALGAGALNLSAGIVCEAMLLAAVGGLVGLQLAVLATSRAIAAAPQHVPRVNEVAIDGVSWLFAAILCVAAALACAGMPLVRLWLRQPVTLINRERAQNASTSGTRARHVLMAVQVALAVVLLCGAGLMLRSFNNLLRVNPGFDSSSQLVFDANLSRQDYRTRADAARFHSALLDRLAALPGVTGVGATSTLPLEGVGLGDPLAVRGRPVQSADTTPMVRFRRVSQDYFTTLRIPLRAGRLFDNADRDGETDSVIIDEALARLYFGDADPLGQRIRPIEGDRLDRWLTIVGVVGATATTGLAESASTAKMYVPLSGSMWADVPAPYDMTYLVRVSGDPTAVIAPARDALAGLNPRVALARPERFDDVLARARASLALTLLLLSAAAVVASGVGAVGIYAVVSYAVAQRRAEIGVRIAVGATPGQVTTLIVRQGVRVIVSGVLAGVVLSLAGAALLRSLLFGVEPSDWLTHASVAVATLLVGAAASWWPAWRGARSNPMRALRDT
jgi:putative ABC transport system permease protein